MNFEYYMLKMHKQTFYIDKITNSIEIAATGQSLDSHISLILPIEIKTIFKKNGWLFNWRNGRLCYSGSAQPGTRRKLY